MSKTPDIKTPELLEQPILGKEEINPVDESTNSFSFRVGELLKEKTFFIDKELLIIYPFLVNYIENIKYYFWETWFTKNDILWQWDFGLVIKLPNNRVMKIWKTKEDSDKLSEESINQEAFYLKLIELREKHWNKIIPNWFKIPIVMESPLKNDNWYYSFEMEFIGWITLRNLDIKANFRDKLEWLSLEEIEKMNDTDLENFLIWKWLTIDEIVYISYNWVWILESYFKEKWQIVRNILELLKIDWYEHTDLHTKNIMLSWDDIIMIDYWIVIVPEDIKNKYIN